MINIQNITLTIPDIVLLMGTAQCLYIMIYLLLRAGRLSRATIPLLYFVNLTAAFVIGFIQNNIPSSAFDVFLAQSVLWTLQFPLCTLLIIQVAQIYKVPSWPQYWVLLLAPLAYGSAYILMSHYGQGCSAIETCGNAKTWFDLAGLIAAIIAMLTLMGNWSIVTELISQKNHKERYWLILALILTNTAFIAATLLNIGLEQPTADNQLISSLFSLVLVYLSGTSLLRIYPQAVNISTTPGGTKQLSHYETSVAKAIENLIYVQKVYHEPNYSRSDMARECEVAEGVLSKVLNTHFKQSFPQLMNTHRVEDAKRLLLELDEPMNILAKEAGFNSLATFNRVFKDIAGESPTEFKGKSR